MADLIAVTKHVYEPPVYNKKEHEASVKKYLHSLEHTNEGREFKMNIQAMILALKHQRKKTSEENKECIDEFIEAFEDALAGRFTPFV